MIGFRSCKKSGWQAKAPAPRRPKPSLNLLALAVGISFLCPSSHAQAADGAKQQYQARCAGCHGEDGTGGGHGPNMVDVRRPRATSQEAVRNLILKGIPGGGMPAFQISEQEADAIAAYVMKLKQPAAGGAPASPAAPGDAVVGQRFFAGEGNCASCHMVRGQGGVAGPDLSNIGHDRTPAEIEQALRDPGGMPAGQAGRGRGGRGGGSSYRAVTVRLKNGQTIHGIAKNESAFDLQVLSVEGKLNLLVKDQVAEVVREKSLMPKVEAPPEEMRDLVAYLSSLRSEPGATTWRSRPMASASTSTIRNSVRFACMTSRPMES